MYCDHEETDTRAFFFIVDSPLESTSLVISFDTDLINIYDYQFLTDYLQGQLSFGIISIGVTKNTTI